MCAETSKLQEINSVHDTLLIATVAMLAVVMVLNCFVLALHRYVYRINREGKSFQIQKYRRCIEIVGFWYRYRPHYATGSVYLFELQLVIIHC